MVFLVLAAFWGADEHAETLVRGQSLSYSCEATYYLLECGYRRLVVVWWNVVDGYSTVCWLEILVCERLDALKSAIAGLEIQHCSPVIREI